MPKAPRPLARHRAFSQQLTRQLSDEDARECYRRRVFGGPGPIDCWLCVNSSGICDSNSGICDSNSPLPEGEVQCTVQVLYEPTIEDDCGFVDPDTYTLSLTIATPSHSSAEAGSPDAPQTHPKIILTTYRGWKESMDAPDWTRRKPGRELVFRQSKQELALLLSRVASARANVKPLIKQLESMQL